MIDNVASSVKIKRILLVNRLVTLTGTTEPFRLILNDGDFRVETQKNYQGISIAALIINGQRCSCWPGKHRNPTHAWSLVEIYPYQASFIFP
jgi:hypothetical protein